MTRQHSIRVGIDENGLWLRVECPYEPEDVSRPCAVFEHPEQRAGFDAELCGLSRWLEDIGQEDFVGLFDGSDGIEVDTPIEFTWSDDGPRWRFTEADLVSSPSRLAEPERNPHARAVGYLALPVPLTGASQIMESYASAFPNATVRNIVGWFPVDSNEHGVRERISGYIFEVNDG